MDQQQRHTNTGYEKLGTWDTRKDHAETTVTGQLKQWNLIHYTY